MGDFFNGRDPPTTLKGAYIGARTYRCGRKWLSVVSAPTEIPPHPEAAVRNVAFPARPRRAPQSGGGSSAPHRTALSPPGAPGGPGGTGGDWEGLGGTGSRRRPAEHSRGKVTPLTAEKLSTVCLRVWEGLREVSVSGLGGLHPCAGRCGVSDPAPVWFCCGGAEILGSEHGNHLRDAYTGYMLSTRQDVYTSYNILTGVKKRYWTLAHLARRDFKG